MAAETDIELRPVFNTDGIKSSARNLRKEIQEVFDASEGKKLDSQMQSLQTRMSKLAGKSREVAKEMEALANKKIPTETYSKATEEANALQKELKTAQTEMNKLESAHNRALKMQEAAGAEYERTRSQQIAAQKQLEQAEKAYSANRSSAYLKTQYEDAQKEVERLNNLLETTKRHEVEVAEANKPVMDAYFNASERVEELKNKLAEVTARMQELKDSGKAFTFGTASEEMRKLEEEQKNLYNEMAITVNKAYELDPALKNAVRGTEDARKSSKGLEKAFSNISKVADNLAKTALTKLRNGFSKLLNTVKGTGKAVGKLGFGKILGYAIGIRGLYALFEKLKKAVTDAMQNMAKLNGGNNEVNKSLSALQSSLTTLKNAWGAAFAPILSAVAPILTTLIDLCTRAANAIGMLFAMLSGQKTFIKAKKVQQDYTKSLAGTGAAADSTRDKLAAFDDLDVLGEDTAGGGGGGAGLGDMFEEVPTEAKDLKELLADLKDFLKDIDWESIKAAAEELGRKVADFLNTIFADEELAALLGRTIAEMLNTALHFAYGFIDQLNWLQMGRWFGTLVQSGIEAFEWDLLGKTIAKFLNGVADSIIGFFQTYQVGTLGSAIAEMFNNAIAGLDAAKIGEAIGDVVGGILAEFSAFIQQADIDTAGQKFFEIVKTILTTPLHNGQQTLGYLVGQAIANLLNIAFSLIVSASHSDLDEALAQFFQDVIKGAIENIDLGTVVEGFLDLLLYLVESIINMLLVPLRALMTALSLVPGEVGTMADSVLQALGTVDESFDTARDVVHEWGDAISEECNKVSTATNTTTTNSQQMASAMNEHFAQMNSSANTAAGGVETSMSNMDTSVSTHTGNVNNYIDITGQNMNTNLGNVQTYETETTTALDNVSVAAQNTDTTIQDLGVTVGEQLALVTETIDLWYQDIMATYFSFEAWSTVFTDGMIAALNQYLQTFESTWNTKMSSWMSTTTTKYFTTLVWLPKWNVILNAYKSMWNILSNTWNTNMKTWMETNKTQYFALNIWQQFGKNMQDGLYAGLKGIVAKTGQIVNALIGLMNSACSNLANAMNALISQYNSAASQIEGAPTISANISYSPVPHVSIPALARGAVIPPNREFLAVLGDQRSGTNIEAPLETIKQAFEDVVANMEVQNTGYSEMQLDGETFARLIVPYVISELGREGYNVEVLEA